MMCGPVPLLLVVISMALAAPATLYDDTPVIVPQKRAALVLDRLLIALQKALQDDVEPRRNEQSGRGWPRTAPLRLDTNNIGDMKKILELSRVPGYELPVSAEPRDEILRLAKEDDMTGLQRRGQAGPGRGRVLRCYFNAVTCF
ncbi:uncharacterized protein LOC131843788 [Achroia grisella]|uniref:uncharacterized protein LOC131843788 n=1 Tax=Achroia grisella TaxID=688607 RepID=UPI0027D2C0B8|nr:uncharacterized protein LOC131843788 [Achroia grisella]